MNNRYAKLGLIFFGLICGLQGCKKNTDSSSIDQDYGKLSLKIDTTEFNEERFFSINYKLISLKEGYFKIELDLRQNKDIKKDSIFEYLLAGDTLKGTSYYVDFPVSEGLVKVLGRLNYKPDNNH
tara:strand:+ start:8495 stop:8869 length:375 start_codon:yes stop_codon:yes gene_type:complete